MKKHYYVFSSLLLSAAIIVLSCGGGGGSSSPFSQADLAGDWYLSVLQSGPSLTTAGEPGWIRGTASIDNAGHITITSLYTSLTGTDPVPGNNYPQGMVLAVNPRSGIITEMSGTNPTDFHGKLASNKKIVVGTATSDNGATQLRIMQKIVSGVTYSTSDIADKSFMIHQIESGASMVWMHAAGTSDSSGATSLSAVTYATGTAPDRPGGTITVDPGTGLIRTSANSYFLGMMSPDKTYIVGTETDSSNNEIFRLTIVQITPPGPSFLTSDLAGPWHFHGVIGAMPAWIYQSLSVDSSGVLTITSELANGNPTGNVPRTVSVGIDSLGNSLPNAGDPTFHATLSAKKDMLVSTQTITDGGNFFPLFGITVK